MAYRSSQHRTEVVAHATPEARSQFGILDRFLAEAADGAGGRFVSWANHDTCAKTMHTTLAVTEAEQFADRIIVVTRDATAQYDNEFVDGAWAAGPPPTRPSLAGVAAWSARETAGFNDDIARAEVRVHRDVPVKTSAWPSYGTRGWPPRSPSRSAASPSAKARTGRRPPPALAARHRWVSDELIVPSYLSGVVTALRARTRS
ncbi:zeta toxin family protein [Streptomyces sp. NPDC057781]|uniref:zeta toxin family protein n=1 Tax=unclassified Streptomyces TaxID=2593676 RepID=UPI0036CAEA0F